MAALETPERDETADLIAALTAPEAKREFHQIVRVLHRLAATKRRARKGAADPIRAARDPLRFKAALGMRHPSVEVVKITPSSEGPTELTVSFLGLTGPMGVLPDHYTEFLVRETQARNLAPAQFFDLFNHRLISLFYRVWAKYRVLVRVEESPGRLQDPFAQVLASVSGLGLARQLAWLEDGQEDLLSVAGVLAKRVKSAGSLERLITELYGVQTAVEEFHGRWIEIPTEDRTRLSSRAGERAFACLGEDAVVGRSVWDVQTRVQLRLGPLSRADFDALLGHEGRLGSLHKLVRLALGPSIDFEIRLTLKAADVPRSRLSSLGVSRLGQTGWLLEGASHEDRNDARLTSAYRRAADASASSL